MNEMIERVALAIVSKRVALEIEADGFAVPTNPQWYADIAIDDADRAEARAAVEAMREPTESMLLEGCHASNINMDNSWRAMIDAALNEDE